MQNLPAELWKWDAVDLARAIRAGAIYSREAVGEALTGVCAGRVLSREITAPRCKSWVHRGAEAVRGSRRPHRCCRIGQAAANPARSETPRTRGNISHGNREIPRPSAVRWEAFAA